MSLETSRGSRVQAAPPGAGQGVCRETGGECCSERGPSLDHRPVPGERLQFGGLWATLQVSFVWPSLC